LTTYKATTAELFSVLIVKPHLEKYQEIL
jgi:hypothetical protein